MRLALSLSLLFAVGCSEYGLNSGLPDVTDPDVSELNGDDGAWWEDPWREPPDGWTDAYGEDAWNVGTFPPDDATDPSADDPNGDSTDPSADDPTSDDPDATDWDPTASGPSDDVLDLYPSGWGDGSGGSGSGGDGSGTGDDPTDPNTGIPGDDTTTDSGDPGGDDTINGHNGNGGGGGGSTTDDGGGTTGGDGGTTTGDDGGGTTGGGSNGGGGGGTSGDPARMTGGGLVDDRGVEISHGFTVHCAGSHFANRMQINWANGSFHLEGVDWVACLDDPNLDPQHPVIPFDTVVGSGWGRLSNGQTVDIWFKFTDDGEPGTDDSLDIEIDTGIVPIYSEGLLLHGNHQAHGPVHRN